MLDQWPGEIVWHGFEVGNVLITGECLKQTPPINPVRRGYELRRHAGRASIDGGQPSYDQAAALFAVRGAEPQYWQTVTGGRAIVDDEGMTRWQPDAAASQAYVKIAGDPAVLAAELEALMIAPPKKSDTRGIPMKRIAILTTLLLTKTQSPGDVSSVLGI